MIFYDVSDETMTARLLKRAETSGRVDDNEETIKKRLETFNTLTKPVVDYYTEKNKLKKVLNKVSMFRQYGGKGIKPFSGFAF